MNRLLEQTPIPTLWTTNSAGGTCEVVLRRMMFAVELRQPPSHVRARIWSRQLAKHDIESDGNDARSLASEYDVTPGVASGVTAAAELVDGGGLDAVRCGVRSLARLLSRERPPQGVPERFDPGLVRADSDLVSLADRLAKAGPGAVSFCLQGPPGTGKSAFVRYLAERMGIEVVQKRAGLHIVHGMDWMDGAYGTGTAQSLIEDVVEHRCEHTVRVAVLLAPWGVEIRQNAEPRTVWES